MAPKITDPNTFLSNLVYRKGKSDLYGVYLTGVNILASATENYEYDVPLASIEKEVEHTFLRDVDVWNQVRVATRLNNDEVVFPISYIRGREPITIYFVVEGNDMGAMVFIPTLVVSEFVTEVTFYQELVKSMAKFAGKTPTTIKFTLGVASAEWDEMVDQGHAREVDMSF